MRELTYNEAALEAIAEEMRLDPKIFYMSTDTIPPLLKEFGEQRIKATPITCGQRTQRRDAGHGNVELNYEARRKPSGHRSFPLVTAPSS